MNEVLKEGYAAFNKKLFRRAVDCYKEAVKIATVTPLKVSANICDISGCVYLC